MSVTAEQKDSCGPGRLAGLSGQRPPAAPAARWPAASLLLPPAAASPAAVSVLRC